MAQLYPNTPSPLLKHTIYLLFTQLLHSSTSVIMFFPLSSSKTAIPFLFLIVTSLYSYSSFYSYIQTSSMTTPSRLYHLFRPDLVVARLSDRALVTRANPNLKARLLAARQRLQDNPIEPLRELNGDRVWRDGMAVERVRMCLLSHLFIIIFSCINSFLCFILVGCVFFWKPGHHSQPIIGKGAILFYSGCYVV